MKLGFFRNQSGAAAVEFGLIAPIFAGILVTVGTMGGTVLAYNKMSQAVSSGAQYALTVDDDVTEIEDVVEAAWEGMPAGADVNVVQACFCAGVADTCGEPCDDLSHPHRITTISASRAYVGLAGVSRTLNAEQEVRTR
jgi:Flp pilus assembly protein TadG